MSHFIGLESIDDNSIIDYWMTQVHLDFSKFGSRIQLQPIYSQSKMVEKLSTSDFHFLKCLGKGACGEVYLVRSKVTGYMFALKQFPKKYL